MSMQTVSVAADDSVEVGQVGGDLQVVGWDQPQLQANGDAVRVERRSGSVAVSCSGDLMISSPRNVRITVSSVGGDVQLEDLTGAIELSLVGGDASLRNLTGPVQLVGMIGGETHMENVSNISVSSSKAGDRFNIAERVRRKVEQATQRAEARIHRAEQRAFQASQPRGRRDDAARWTASANDASSTGQVDRVTDEERMAILKMLQDRKITSEQADQLLSALEGNA
jgi:hypothetical protein